MTTAQVTGPPQPDEDPGEFAPVYLLHRRVAGHVRAEAARFGDNQLRIAEVLGVSQGGASRRWRGITPFTVDELALLADRYGLTPGQLVDGTARGAKWAPWDSNPQPADYKMAGSAVVLPFARPAAPVITRRAS